MKVSKTTCEQAAETPRSKAAWKSHILGLLIFLAVTVVLLPWLKPLRFDFGDTSIIIRAGITNRIPDFGDRDFGFSSVEWDGPTGEMSHGRTFGFKLHKWVYRVDETVDPKAAVRRSLIANIPGLVKAMDSPNFLVRETAAQILVEQGLAAKQSLPALIVRLDKDDQIIADVVQRISQLDVEYAVPLLVNCLDNGNGLARNHAIEILGELGPPATNAIPALLRTLGKNSPKTQILAALSLAKINNRIADPVPVLINLLTNGDAAFRTGAICALGEFGPLAGPAVPILIPLLKDHDQEVRWTSAALSARSDRLLARRFPG